MTRYFTEISPDLLPTIRGDQGMPPTLRYIRDVGPGPDGTTIVELEDDEAGAWMAGRMVTPTISIAAGRTFVSGHDVGPRYAPDPEDR